MTIIAPIKAQFDSARDYAASLAYGPLVQLARAACLNLFKRIEIGSLEITDTDDTVIQCGRPGKEGVAPHTTLRVQKDTFWVRLLLFADMVRQEETLEQTAEANQGTRASLKATC